MHDNSPIAAVFQSLVIPELPGQNSAARCDEVTIPCRWTLAVSSFPEAMILIRSWIRLQSKFFDLRFDLFWLALQLLWTESERQALRDFHLVFCCVLVATTTIQPL